MSAFASVWAYYLCAWQRVCPRALLHLFEVPLVGRLFGEDVLGGEVLAIVEVDLLANGRHVYVVVLLLAEQCVAVEPVTADAHNGGGVDAFAVDHYREVAVELATALSDDGYGLSGTHVLSHLYYVLGVVGVDGLESVAVAYHGGVAHVGELARDTYRAVEHCLHCVAVLGGYLHDVVLAQGCFAHGQRERVLVRLQCIEVDVEGVGTAEESGCGYAYLLLFGSGELMFDGGCRHECECGYG